MENIVVLNEEQFEDIIYRTVNRCLNEKMMASMIVTRCVNCYISSILLFGVLKSLAS